MPFFTSITYLATLGVISSVLLAATGWYSVIPLLRGKYFVAA
jgi:hypothetical protein